VIRVPPPVHPLAEIIQDADAGRFPAADGGWSRVPTWRDGVEGIVCFTGMLSDQWTIAEFTHVDIRKMTFSSLQASLMRTTIENDYPSFAARAARVGSGQPTN